MSAIQDFEPFMLTLLLCSNSKHNFSNKYCCQNMRAGLRFITCYDKKFTWLSQTRLTVHIVNEKEKKNIFKYKTTKWRTKQYDIF